MAIKSVSIRAIRGIRHELLLPLDGKSWLIHGDNGTGKSSIERALRWALLGTEEPSSEKVLSSEAGCRRHILEPEDSPRVVVELAKTGRIEASATGLIVDEAGQAFRSACCQGNPFLRRLELLEFLNSKPVDRFRYLDSYLDLIVVDEALQKFSDKEKALSRIVSSSEQAIRAKLTSIGNRLPSDLRPTSFHLSDYLLATARLGVRLNLLETELATWRQITDACQKAETLAEGDALDTARRNLSNASEALAKLTVALVELEQNEIGSLDAERSSLEQVAVLAKLAPLLELARTHISTDETEQCPVCERSVDRRELLGAITVKLNSLSHYRGVVNRISYLARQWRDAWRDFANVAPILCVACSVENAAELPGMEPAPAGTDLLYSNDLTEEAFRSALLVVGPSALLKWCRHFVDISSTTVNLLNQRLPQATALGELRTFSDAARSLEEERKNVDALHIAKELANKQHFLMQTVRESMRKARQDVAQGVFDEIGNKVAEFYAAIHPEVDECEVTKAPSIEVQRHAGGTAFVRGQFANQVVKDPKWIYSDGHLDTVGICIFLALSRYRSKATGSPKLMVLDDVVLSIDLGHARRLIALLRDEFTDHQLLIFTHNELFARWCTGLMPSIKRINVLGWTLEAGPQIGDYTSSIARLKEHIHSSSPKEIAMNLMWFMDELLAECRFAYSLSVPAKRGEEYTLTEIWEPFAKVIKDLAKKIGDEMNSIVAHLELLKDVTRIRNMLAAHENEFAQECPRATIAEIASTAISLVESIYCTHCNSFAAAFPNRNEPQLLTCKCEQIRFIKPAKPLKKPAAQGTVALPTDSANPK